jgi:hypothetical protein
MQLPPRSCSFDAETVAMMGRVCDEAWDEVQSRLAIPTAPDPSGIRNLVAMRVMAAVANGERDPKRLKEKALEALDA